MNDTELDVLLRRSAPPALVPDGLDGHTSRILRAARASRSRWARVGIGAGVTAALLVGGGATAIATGAWEFTLTTTNTDGLTCTATFRVTGLTKTGPNTYEVATIGQQGDVSDALWAAANEIAQGIDIADLDRAYIEQQEEWYRANPMPAGAPQLTKSQIKRNAVIDAAGKELVDQLVARGFAQDEIKLGLGGSEVGCA